MLAGAGGDVEERGLAAVGVADEGYIDGLARARGDVLAMSRAGSLARSCLFDSHRLDLDKVGLGAPQRYIVAHDLILDGVTHRGMEEHLYAAAAHKSHLHHPLAESAVTKYLHDDTLLAGL